MDDREFMDRTAIAVFAQLIENGRDGVSAADDAFYFAEILTERRAPHDEVALLTPPMTTSLFAPSPRDRAPKGDREIMTDDRIFKDGAEVIEPDDEYQSFEPIGDREPWDCGSDEEDEDGEPLPVDEFIQTNV